MLSYGFLALIVLVGGLALYRTNPQVRNTIALATTVKPETFTELYFEDHTHLPLEIKPTYTPPINFPLKGYVFAFTIHNLENKDMQYPYEVYIDLAGEKTLIEKKTVVVKNNESKTIKESFSALHNSPTRKIVVNLIEKNQQIDFWMKEPAISVMPAIKR